MSACDLLLWKNPLETGKVFGGLLVSLLILKKVNLVTFFLRVIYTTLFAASVIEFVSKRMLGQGLVTRYGVKECPNISGILRPKIEEFFRQFPVYQLQIKKLLFASSPKHSFKTASLFYILHKLVSVISLWTLMLLSVIATFSLPVIYMAYRKEIDTSINEGVSIVKMKSCEYQTIAKEKAAPYLDQLHGRFGPLCEYFSPKTLSCGTTASDSLNSTDPAIGCATGSSFTSVPSPGTGSRSVKEENIEEKPEAAKTGA